MDEVIYLCFLLLLTTSSVIESFPKYMSFLWDNANIGNFKCGFSTFCITGDVCDKIGRKIGFFLIESSWVSSVSRDTGFFSPSFCPFSYDGTCAHP